MPNIVHINGVEHLQVQSLRGILKRRSFRGIILEGGSPCQGNSILNASRTGLKDQRSQQHALLERLLHDLEQETWSGAWRLLRSSKMWPVCPIK